MSIVMSTMAKQQASPGAFKLDAICEKLKKTSEDGNDDDVDDSLEMHPYNLSDNNNGSHSGLYHHHHSHSHSGIMPNGSGDEDDEEDDDDECMDEGPLMSSPPRRSCFPSNSHEALYGDDSNSNSEVANCSIGGDAMSMRSDDTSMNDSEAKELSYETSTPTEGGLPYSGGGGGRRNKRKNFKPRNIVYQYDACEDALEGEAMAEEYPSSQQHRHHHSRHEDFHDTSDDGGNEMDQPSSSSARLPRQGNCCSSSKNHEQPLDLSGDPGCPPSNKSSHMSQQQRHMDDAGAMDLSVRHSDSEDEGHNGMAMDLSKSKMSSAEAETSCSSSDDALTTSATTVSASDPLTSTSVAVGTSTMPSSSSSPGASAGGAAGATANRSSPTSVVMSGRSALGLQRDAAMRMGSLSPSASTTLHGMPSTSTDASAMKDYAESTMKELLGLYGFNDMAESITKSVPLDNFYSGKILETMSPRLFGASPASLGLCPPTSVASSSPSGLQVTSTQRTPSPQHQQQHQPPPPPLPQQQQSHPSQHSSPHPSHPSVQQPHPPHHHHHHHHHHSPAVSHASNPSSLHPHHREGIYDSLCNKVVDSMAKLASLPPNSIIGNPRVILPPNMTTTILTLAAMQDTKFAAAAMAAAAGNTQNKPPVLEPMTQPSIVSPQPSVIVSSSSSPLNVPIPKDPISKAGHIDYTRYVKRYANATECGSNYCKDLNYREHFHCMDCNSRVFVKKEEMIRHFKWHKKRDESLQHGFLRFSPMDDCSDKFQNCSHNRKQTHYHCLKDGCDKVYISTSDVQMHANYHRKDSAIIQEGFQRFRATEDCGVSSCTFFGQRTTHFHCRRANCNYTFKNKADMEKHKTYHIKDEQLNRDGFKKFMKHENCPFESCRFSRVCNHIHCIRAGCSYVLHSSGQLYSHKRKHERSENEMAYRKFKLAQSMLKTFSENQSFGIPGQMSEEGNSSESTSSGIQTSNAVPVIQSSSSPAATTSNTGSLPTLAGTAPSTASTSSFSISNSNNHHHPNYQQYLSYHSLDQQSLSQLASLLTGVNLNTPLGLPLSLLPPGSKPLSEQMLASQLASVTGMPTPEHLAAMDLTSEMLKPKPDDSWKRYLTRYTANDPCKANCDFLYKDHYHCTAENCHMMFRSKDGVREHARTHEQQDQVTEAFYTTVEAGHPITCPTDCPYQNKEKHYHCCWESCREIILPSDKAFRRLDHYKMHDYSRKLNTGKDPLSMTLTTSIDGMFKRKRGRPPKNRVIEFPMPSSPSDLPQAIFTSFKLPKPSTALGLNTGVPCTTAAHSILDKHGTPISAVATPYGLVPTAMLTARPGGNPAVSTTMATPLTMSMLNQMAPSHMQQKVEVQDGFYIFPKNTPCPDRLCPYFGLLHYHCTRPRCFYATDRTDILTTHSRDFHGNVEIIEGFAYFDRDVDCRLASCQNNKLNRHYHCTRPSCNYSFVRYSSMTVHDQTHSNQGNENVTPPSPTTSSTSGPHSPPVLHPIRNSPSPTSSMSPPLPSLSVPDNVSKSTIVKATGTFYPLSAFPQYNRKKSHSESQVSYPQDVQAIPESRKRSNTEGEVGDDQSLSKLLQQPLVTAHTLPDWQLLLDRHAIYAPSNPCGRPFCKLKKAKHYHCNICNQAFSTYLRLQPHLQKHAGTTSPVSSAQGGSSHSTGADDDSAEGGDEADQYEREQDEEEGDNSSTPRQPHISLPGPTEALSNLHASLYSNAVGEAPPLFFPQPRNLATMPGYHSLLSHAQALARSEERRSPQQNGSNSADFEAQQSPHDSVYPNSGKASPNQDENLDSNPASPHWMGSSSRKRSISTSPRNEDYSDAKRSRVSSSMASLRILKDEPVPEGYIRYRFNEDCHYTHCGYREHQTHFHCIRRDCGYSFCDKTRFVQHTARHERLDTLMGGDFQQFRANIPCGRADCLYTVTMSATGSAGNKASHFHCLKCDFVCTDTNKVVAHRRQHQKLDSIMAAGFEKFTPTQNCQMEGCSHNQKQTHYHCVKCQYAVLGLSQMSAHKYRHLE